MIVFDSPIEIQVGQLCFYDFEAGPSLVGITVFDQRQETYRGKLMIEKEDLANIFHKTSRNHGNAVTTPDEVAVCRVCRARIMKQQSTSICAAARNLARNCPRLFMNTELQIAITLAW